VTIFNLKLFYENDLSNWKRFCIGVNSIGNIDRGLCFDVVLFGGAAGLEACQGQDDQGNV
jgi:hypothetical protein